MSLNPDEGRMWRTDSDMSVLFVSGPTVASALMQLSRALVLQNLSRHVIDLQFVSHPEEGGLKYTVGAVIEKDFDE